MIRVYIPGEPVAQGRPRASRMGDRIIMRDPSKARAWKRAAAVHMLAAMRKARAKPLRGPLQATIRAFWPSIKPDRKRRPRRRTWRPKLPDADNVAKAVMDAGNGILYGDDGQVVRLVVEKWHAAQGQLPRVEVEISEISLESGGGGR